MSSSRGLIILYAALLVAGVFLLVYPFYVNYPFRSQGSRELQAAFAVTQYRFPVLAALAVFAFALVLMSRPHRILGAVCVVSLTAIAVFSRVNLFELMFHPYGQPAFTNAATAKLDDDEMVLAVRGTSSARAYPIRSLSYHHILNDVLDGVPIAATY